VVRCSETAEINKIYIIDVHAIKMFKPESCRNTFMLGVLVIAAFGQSVAGKKNGAFAVLFLH
jgi:hypothetical protein